MQLSRDLTHKAQKRKSITIQPITGIKATITIKNYLRGYYYFTCDEVEIHGDELHLIEAKRTKTSTLPSEGVIKDGLIKMILFTNLENVSADDHEFRSIPILKLTTINEFRENLLNSAELFATSLLALRVC